MKRLIVSLLCVLWMGFIFYNSSNIGQVSNERSYNLLNNIRNEYNKVKESNRTKEDNNIKVDKKTIVQNSKPVNKNLNEYKTINSKSSYKVLPNTSKEEKLNLIIRKNAHAFEYFILAILISMFLFSFNLKGRGALIYIMFVCLFYAVTDEFHQMFIPGRTSLVSDVLIDFLGSLIGMAVFYLLYYKLCKVRAGKRSLYA